MTSLELGLTVLAARPWQPNGGRVRPAKWDLRPIQMSYERRQFKALFNA